MHSTKVSTRSRRALPIMVVGLASLLLAACGGGGPVATAGASGSVAGSGAPRPSQAAVTTQAPGGGGTVDACALLPAADIEAAIGLATTSSTAGPQAGIFPSGCEWELIDNTAMVPPTISLGVMTTGGKDYYENYFAPYNEENGFDPIAGLGDEAVDGEAGAVLVLSGDAFFSLQYLGGTLGGDDTQKSTELAKKVVANLGG